MTSRIETPVQQLDGKADESYDARAELIWIGDLLLASEVLFSGSAYCFAPARFGTHADAEILTASSLQKFRSMRPQRRPSTQPEDTPFVSGLTWHESTQHVQMLASDVGMVMEEIFNEHRGEGFDGEMNEWFNHVVQFKGMEFATGIVEA